MNRKKAPVFSHYINVVKAMKPLIPASKWLYSFGFFLVFFSKPCLLL